MFVNLSGLSCSGLLCVVCLFVGVIACLPAWLFICFVLCCVALCCVCCLFTLFVCLFV